MNGCLSGKMNADTGQSYQASFKNEEQKLGEIIKPEYLRPTIEQTTLPG